MEVFKCMHTKIQGKGTRAERQQRAIRR